MLKLYLLILLSVPCILAQYVPPEALVEPLKPKGIRISIPDEDGITLVAFHVKFNDEFMGLEAGTIARDILKPKNGRWTYQDKTTKLKQGDVIYYWIHVVYERLGYNLIDQEHVVTDFYNIDGQKVESGNNNQNPGVQGPYAPPQASVELLKPKGIRISIPYDEGTTLVSFHIKFNDKLVGTQAGTINVDVLNTTNGRWIYEDQRIKLNKGDVVYYWIYVIHNGLGYNLIDQEYVVTESSGNNNNAGDPNQNNQGNNEENTGVQNPSCPNNPSVTKLYNSFGIYKFACPGDLILEEHFRDYSQFNKKWTTITQFSGSPDYEFVVYRDSPYNLKVENGLKITPTLLKDEFGESFIRSGDWKLQSCTETRGSIYCHRRASGWNILPPISSARINTKKSFNFEYGRIEVRARFPYGDWIYPLIILEPVHNDKGSALETLQIRVASSSGNYELKLQDGRDFGGQILWGGVTGLNILEQADRFNESVGVLYNNDLWATDFHTYELIWNPNEITLKADGQVYGQIPVSLPQNTPVYLTFGVAVGGLVEFPDKSISYGYTKPWRNIDAKALYNFFKNSDVLWNTWQYQATSLDVDYVKIYAL